MNTSQSLHVLLIEEDYAVTSRGSDACDAVRSHHEEMDMYCSPPPDFTAEESSITVFSIPQAIEDDLPDDFEDMDSGERAEAIMRHAAEYPEITKTEVKIAYDSGDLQVSQVEPMTLFVADDT